MTIPEDKMKQALAWALQVDSKKIQPFTSLRDDLLLDDLDLQLLISALELRFGIFLTEEEAASIDTVHDLTVNLQRAAA